MERARPRRRIYPEGWTRGPAPAGGGGWAGRGGGRGGGRSVGAAHPDGDSIVFIKDANVLHMGDTFFHTWYPFIDAESGGNIHGMIAVHEKGLALADDKTKIIPGHGPLATKADLQEAHDKLVSVRDALQSRIDKGMSDEEIIADKPLDALDLGWGGFLKPEQFVAITLAGMRS